ncbi:hypothetical protein LENED_001029 [Lentinula edodes]|uniref:Uncharacterized protein n=1 Tax=Lentinula edodes TaxID=5353 RepID=A0A1Q3DXB7_LENED|nr:hypothetical protein LENED_001029 [Lentinula edodes]
MMPSPIAESPAREAAATADEIREELRESKVGPTPLTQVVTTSTDPETPAETVESSRSEAGRPTILGSADEPHILTEEPDEMSLRAHTVESIRESDPNETREAPAPVASAPAPELSPAPVLETAPSYFEAIIENTMGVISTEEPTPEGMQSDQTTPRPHGPADTENASVFYAFSEMPVPDTTQVSADEKPNYFPNSAPGDTIPAANPIADLQRENEIVQMPVPEITGDMTAQIPPVTMPASDPIPIPPKRRDADIEPIPTPGTATGASVHHTTEFASQKPQTKSSGIAIVPYDAGSVEEIWANQSDTQHNQDVVGRQRADSSAQTIQDPFADPVPSIHPSTIGTTGPSVVSEPDITATQNQTSVLTTQTVPNVVVFPIVPHGDIFTRETNDDSVSGGMFHETDETRPLLGPHTAPQTSYLHVNSPQPTTAHLNVSEMPSSTSSSIPWPSTKPTPSHSSMPRLHHLGWIEYALPDSTIYYSHPTLRVTTDIDLRSITKLDVVTAYLEHRRLHDGAGTPPGFELWLREGNFTDGKTTRKRRGLGKTKEFVPVRYWVDHKKRLVTTDPIWDAQGDGSARRHPTGKAVDDSLDMEYRYWAFMEDHPAHVTLPHNARTDAMDILTWCWTDRLLPSQRDLSPPFNQAECQELNNILRSFGDSNGDSGIQAVLHTRLVSRVLMRVARWRQTNFRPNKALPQDIGNRGRADRPRQSGFQRSILDIVVFIVFLGVPSLFLPQSNTSSFYRLDEESGLFGPRSAGPIFLLGGCACLVAAIILSASVTFLSLPGLDNAARIPGLVAVILATFSIVFSDRGFVLAVKVSRYIRDAS